MTFNHTPTIGIGVAVSPDGSRVIALANANPQTINVLTTGANPQLLQEIPNSGNFSQLSQVAFAPDGNTAYVTTLDAGVYVLQNNGGTYSIANTIATGLTKSAGVAVSPDGKKLYVTDYTAATLSVFDATQSSYPLITTLSSSSSGCSTLNNPSFVAVTPDGNTIYVGNRGTSITVITNNNGSYSCTNSIGLGGASSGLAITSDGQYLYAPSDTSSPSKLNIINTATNTINSTIATSPHLIFGVAITPDGSTLFTTQSQPSSTGVLMFQLVNDLPSGSFTVVQIGGGPQDTVGNFAG
jgi:DNA-binding beta-propeller fold protein YncE